jgi:hypothetical protein
VGLLSAAALYGSSHQALQCTQIVTSEPRTDIEIGRLRVSFVMKKSAARTPVLNLRGGYAPVKISSPEATVFDLVRYAQQLGGIERIFEVIGEMKPRLFAAGFRQALQEQLETTLLQRTGFILETLGLTRFSTLIGKKLTARRLQPTPISTFEREDQKVNWRENAWGIYGTVRFGERSSSD